jgi:hypothetical protein
MGFELERAEGGGEDRSGREGNGLDICEVAFSVKGTSDDLPRCVVVSFRECRSGGRTFDKG